MSKLIAPQASPAARQYITAALKIIYSVQTTPAIKQMITGAQTLAKGAAPFVVALLLKLQAKMGPLNPQDEPMVVLHICGAIADIAHELGDPECKNGTAKPVGQMMTLVKQMLEQQAPQQGQPPQQAQQPQQGGPPLQQLGGPQ